MPTASTIQINRPPLIDGTKTPVASASTSRAGPTPAVLTVDHSSTAPPPPGPGSIAAVYAATAARPLVTTKPKPKTTKSPNANSTTMKSKDTATTNNTAATATIEVLMARKKMILSSFEAQFNEKILTIVNESLAEQKRTLLSKNDTNPASEVNAAEVQRVKEEMEEMKFSHEVEVAYLKNKVETLEKIIKWGKKKEGGSGLALTPAYAAPGNTMGTVGTNNKPDLTDRMKELYSVIKQERMIRIQQLKSLEALHFAEFRGIEKKHADFVRQLVTNEASYKDQVKQLKWKLKESESKRARSIKKTTAKKDNKEFTTAAAAALSALAVAHDTVVAAALDDGPSASSANEESDPMYPDLPPLPKDIKESETNSPGISHDLLLKEGSTKKKLPNKPASEILAPNLVSHKRDISEVSDPEGVEGSPNVPPVTVKKRRHSPATAHEMEVQMELQKILETKHKDQFEATITARDSTTGPHVTSFPDSKRKMLSESVKDYLREWMMSPEHCEHPYPSPEQKARMIADTGIQLIELNNWFVNNRRRFWLAEVKPRIEEIKRAQRVKEMEMSYESAAATGV